DEHNAVYAAQHQLAAGVIKHLAGNRVEVKTGAEAADGTQVERQEVEEQRAIGLGGQRIHFTLLLLAGFVEHPLQVGGLAAQTGTVVHDLAVDLARCEVDGTQTLPRVAPRPEVLRYAVSRDRRGEIPIQLTWGVRFIPQSSGAEDAWAVSKGVRTVVYRRLAMRCAV